MEGCTGAAAGCSLRFEGASEVGSMTEGVIEEAGGGGAWTLSVLSSSVVAVVATATPARVTSAGTAEES